MTRPARKIRQEKITPLQSKFVVWMNHEANSVLLIWCSNLVSRVFSIFKMAMRSAAILKVEMALGKRLDVPSHESSSDFEASYFVRKPNYPTADKLTVKFSTQQTWLRPDLSAIFSSRCRRLPVHSLLAGTTQ